MSGRPPVSAGCGTSTDAPGCTRRLCDTTRCTTVTSSATRASVSLLLRCHEPEADLAVRHSYPNLHKWLKRLYWQNPAFKDTTDFERESAFRGNQSTAYSCRYQGALLLLARSNQPYPDCAHRPQSRHRASQGRREDEAGVLSKKEIRFDLCREISGSEECMKST